jgi:hypothetical protein
MTETAILEVVREADRAHWVLGDAIAEEIPVSDNDDREFRALAKDLTKRGVVCSDIGRPYTRDHLRRLRDTALAFPPATRRDDVCWDNHAAAGTPRNLEKVLESLRELDWPATTLNVEFVMATWREKAGLEAPTWTEKRKMEWAREAGKRRAREQSARADAEWEAKIARQEAGLEVIPEPPRRR